MECVDAQKRIQPYLEGKLADDELSPFLDHISHCQECHEELEIYMAAYSALEHEDSEDEIDYNFSRALEERLRHSREELNRRSFYHGLRVIVVAVAQLMLLYVLLSSVRTHLQQRSLDTRFGYIVVLTDETEEMVTEEMTNLPGEVIVSDTSDIDS